MKLPKSKQTFRRRRKRNGARQHKQRARWAWQNEGQRLRNMPPLDLPPEDLDEGR